MQQPAADMPQFETEISVDLKDIGTPIDRVPRANHQQNQEWFPTSTIVKLVTEGVRRRFWSIETHTLKERFFTKREQQKSKRRQLFCNHYRNTAYDATESNPISSWIHQRVFWPELRKTKEIRRQRRLMRKETPQGRKSRDDQKCHLKLSFS